MNILSHKQTETSMQPTKRASGSLIRKIGRFILQLLAGLIALASLLPVALLPVATAVPFLLFLLLAVVDVGLLYALFRWAESGLTRTALVTSLLLVSLLAVLFSQWMATTPPILGADGQPLPGSIASLEQVELNGRSQWITIRGHSSENPVLLFLAGGPGGSHLAATRDKLGGLEEHFVIVNWDQPGAGKSYRAADFETLTPEQYIADGHALTEMLQSRFGQEKIFVMGESWGSLLGVWLVERYPEDYHAMVGLAQMVAFLETDTYDYNLALDIARERGDRGKVEALEAQGPPPYYGAGVAQKVVEYITYLSSYMNTNPEIHTNYNTIGDVAAPEYGLLDKVNYVRGLLVTMENLWEKLWEIDLRQDVPRLEVPIFFIEGRHDVNAPPALVEDYLATLEAPRKELIWFEHSGHSPWQEEPERLADVLVTQVLPLAQ